MPFSDPARDAVFAPGLLVLTGASHTGKTSVAQAVFGLLGSPTAFLSVDDVLSQTLVRPPHGPWTEIPLAYELLESQTEILLDRGWFVVLESTFTYVPEKGSPQFHADVMRRQMNAAERRGVPLLVVELEAGDALARSRVDQTGRLPPQIVARTAELHREASMPNSTLRLQVDEASPNDLAQRIVEELGKRSARG